MIHVEYLYFAYPVQNCSCGVGDKLMSCKPGVAGRLQASSSLLDETLIKVSKAAKMRNRYNQVPHLTQDTNGKVTNSQ